jgi:CheY-like chemotaxis protein
MFAVASKCSVLIVEDHFDTADMLRQYLRRQGVDAEVVGDGMAALEYLEQGTPRCLILDEGMPGMTGLELLRQLKARPEYRGLPVYFYSAAYEWRKQMEAEALGAQGWYIKGVTKLQDMMARVIGECCRAGEQ